MGMSIASQKKLIHRIRFAGEDTFKVSGQRIPAKSLRELMQLEPRSIFAKVTCPVRLIGGSKDLQCDPADIPASPISSEERWKRMSLRI